MDVGHRRNSCGDDVHAPHQSLAATGADFCAGDRRCSGVPCMASDLSRVGVERGSVSSTCPKRNRIQSGARCRSRSGWYCDRYSRSQHGFPDQRRVVSRRNPRHCAMEAPHTEKFIACRIFFRSNVRGHSICSLLARNTPPAAPFWLRHFLHQCVLGLATRRREER